MLKILLISILLTAVYSWDEIKHTLLMLLRFLLRKQTRVRFYHGQTDRVVGSLIMISTIPLGLSFLVTQKGELLQKLIWLTVFLLSASVISLGSSILLSRLRFANGFSGTERAFALSYSFLGLVSPVFQMFQGHSRSDRKTLGKLALLLSLPPLAGIVLKIVSQGSPENTLPQTDLLITILVASMFLRISVDFMEVFFRKHKLKTLFTYYRVVLGIVLSAILLFG